MRVGKHFYVYMYEVFSENLIPVGSGSKMGSHPKSSGPDIAPVKKKSE